MYMSEHLVELIRVSAGFFFDRPRESHNSRSCANPLRTILSKHRRIVGREYLPLT